MLTSSCLQFGNNDQYDTRKIENFSFNWISILSDVCEILLSWCFSCTTQCLSLMFLLVLSLVFCTLSWSGWYDHILYTASQMLGICVACVLYAIAASLHDASFLSLWAILITTILAGSLKHIKFIILFQCLAWPLHCLHFHSSGPTIRTWLFYHKYCSCDFGHYIFRINSINKLFF